MPAKKATSPEAEQKKLWKLEIKQLQTAAKKIDRDFAQAHRAAWKEYKSAQAAYQKAAAKRIKIETRLDKKQPLALKQIDHRIAILEGRLGL